MKQRVFYCKSWFRAKKRATEHCSETEAGVLFLTRAIDRELFEDSDTVVKGTTCRFQPNGKVAIRKDPFNPRDAELIKIERGTP